MADWTGRIGLAVVAACCVLACSSTRETGRDPVGGTSGAPEPRDAGIDAPPTEADRSPCLGACTDDLAARPKPLPRPTCPEQEPMLGAACDQRYLQCSYGDDDLVACRRFYECRESWGWAARYDPERCAAVTDAVAELCPSERPAADASCVITAFGAGIPCAYRDVTCSCVARFSVVGAPGAWQCYGPPRDPACPRRLPNLGEGCATKGKSCYYAPDGCYAYPYTTVFCYQGEWEEAEELPCAL